MVTVRAATGELIGTVCLSIMFAFLPFLLARGFRFIIRVANPPGVEVKDE